VLFYKVAAPVSWLLLVVTGVVYEFHAPNEGHKPRKSIWGNNRPTPFAQNSVMTSIYW
jgi:hypothetical protein